jgi:hypothetical protein
MLKVIEYFGRIQSVRGRMLGLPAWARFLVFIAAIPGILLLSLSILAVLVSILALLLLTVPLYRVLNALVGHSEPAKPTSESAVADFFAGDPATSPGRKKVDVTIIE